MATPGLTTASLAAMAVATPDIKTPSPSTTPPLDPDSSHSPGQRYCLKWNNYQSNVTSTFKELLAVEDFVDITLMAEGGSLRAHKVVLSACSTYFRDILRRIEAWQHPVIVLKDVPISDLQGIVEFIYHGEVSIDQTSLESFLKTAQLLRVKGLTDDAIVNNNNSSNIGNGNEVVSGRRTLLPQKPHMHHPRKSSRPTRAIVKRDNNDFPIQDEPPVAAKRPTIQSSASDESQLVSNEVFTTPLGLKSQQVAAVAHIQRHLLQQQQQLQQQKQQQQQQQQQSGDEIDEDDEDEEEEIDDVEEDDNNSGDEEEEEVPPFFGSSLKPGLSRDEWSQSEERKQRQQMLMGGGELSIVPVGLDKFFDPSNFGMGQVLGGGNSDDNMAGGALSGLGDGGQAGSSGVGGNNGPGQKKTCPYCYQQLSWHALSRHIRDMHRAKTGYVTCKFCFKMFRNKNSLGCHMWRFHKDAKDQQQQQQQLQPDSPSSRSDEPAGPIPMQN